MIKIRNFLFFLSIIFILNACATTSDLEVIRNDLRNAKIAALHQQKEISDLKIKVSEIASELTALKEITVKEPAFGAIKESQGSILDEVSRLHGEVQAIKGRLEENKLSTDKSFKELILEREQQNTKILALEKELQDIKAKIAPQATEKKDAQVEQKVAKEGSLGPPQKLSENDPDKIFETAQSQFKEKKFAEARANYERLIRDFPKHNNIILSHFGVAESYYMEKKYEDAILAYENFIKKYPNHEKARLAMLRQGYSFYELGDKKTGKIILEKLIEKYPRSAETEMAKKKLAEELSKRKKR
ncbi:MAG: tetratricopeptide repeat protein [Thermodesulfovibrionales bacterium]|nr:tetratricopeptide repeat protein [Thermodesulfovibrionales bacterium]